jgi:D-lactate dehydrogenase
VAVKIDLVGFAQPHLEKSIAYPVIFRHCFFLFHSNKYCFMKVLFYSSKDFELPYLETAAYTGFEIKFVKEALSLRTASFAIGYDAVSIFTADDASAQVIRLLRDEGIKYIAVRAAGYDNVDINAANRAGIRVANTPGYSPNAIAEHTVAMMLALNRKLMRANEQVHKQNFTLSNLVGFDLNRKKVGIIGTGRIGGKLARIMHGFGCTLLAYDITRSQTLEHRYNVFYTGLNTLCSMCDIITIHLPLNEQTRYMIDKKLIQTMKPGVMLINTSRGGIVKTQDVIDAIACGQIGYFGMDVYEHEKGIFFHNREGESLHDPMLSKLMGFSNVLITPHQAFATEEALKNITATTFYNLSAWMHNAKTENEITYLENVKLMLPTQTKTKIA